MVNADDFGFTPDVNEGIVEAHQHGILTSTTLMANGGAFEDAVRLASQNPALGVGCHLVLIGGRSVRSPHGALPSSVPRLLAAIVSGLTSLGRSASRSYDFDGLRLIMIEMGRGFLLVSSMSNGSCGSGRSEPKRSCVCPGLAAR